MICSKSARLLLTRSAQRQCSVRRFGSRRRLEPGGFAAAAPPTTLATVRLDGRVQSARDEVIRHGGDNLRASLNRRAQYHHAGTDARAKPVRHLAHGLHVGDLDLSSQHRHAANALHRSQQRFKSRCAISWRARPSSFAPPETVRADLGPYDPARRPHSKYAAALFILLSAGTGGLRATPVTASMRRNPRRRCFRKRREGSDLAVMSRASRRTAPADVRLIRPAVRMTRTTRIFFSKKRHGAGGDSLFIAFIVRFNGIVGQTKALTFSTTASSSVCVNMAECVKSKRMRSGATSDPAC